MLKMNKVGNNLLVFNHIFDCINIPVTKDNILTINDMVNICFIYVYSNYCYYAYMRLLDGAGVQSLVHYLLQISNHNPTSFS